MQFEESGKPVDLHINRVLVAGWTGRDKVSVNHHIQELLELGVSPPSQTPLYYRVSDSLLTQRTNIQVLGQKTSGEVEPLLIQQRGSIWIGLASDHTDRELEAHSVAASKQACMKPVSRKLWSFSRVKEHLDSLILRCKLKENNQWVVYQEGTLATIMPLTNLIRDSDFGDNSAMLCGTLSAIGGVRPAIEYSMELIDPILNKNIQLNYTVSTLPEIA